MAIKVALVILFSASLSFGQASAGGPPPQYGLPPVATQSDAAAQSVLSGVLSAAGGLVVLSTLRDFTALGTIAYNWAGQQDQGSVTFRGLGASDFRLDAQLTDGTRSWAVNGGVGTLASQDGSTEVIPGHNAINLGSLSYPYLWLAAAATAATTTVSSEGAAVVNGVNTVDIRVQLHYSTATDPNGTLAQLSTRDFFIDPTSFLIVKAEFMTHPVNTISVSLPEDIYYSNYQQVNGAVVPFTIMQTVNGQQIWTAQLSSIQFNTGLSSANFTM